jgi:hypothetical protein
VNGRSLQLALEAERAAQRPTPHQRWEREQWEALAVRDEARRQLAVLPPDPAASAHRLAVVRP